MFCGDFKGYKTKTLARNGFSHYQGNIYLFIAYNRNTRIKCEMCSKLTIKTPEQRHSSVSIVDFEQLNVSWVMTNVPIMQKLVN